jgi:hypothetical protein
VSKWGGAWTLKRGEIGVALLATLVEDSVLYTDPYIVTAYGLQLTDNFVAAARRVGAVFSVFPDPGVNQLWNLNKT